MSGEPSQSTSTTRKTLHNTNCCVYKCSSRKNKDRTLHFHAFPKKDASKVHVKNAYGLLEKVDRRKAWTNALLMGKMRVCSLHFEESDYLAKGAALQGMNRPNLKSTAVPSRNLPKAHQFEKFQRASPTKAALRKQRSERRSILRDITIKPHFHNIEPLSPEKIEYKHPEFTDLTEEEQCVVQSLLDLKFVKKSYSDRGLQVTSGDSIISFTSTIKSNAQLNSLTGIPNFEMLNSFIELISEMYPDKKKS